MAVDMRNSRTRMKGIGADESEHGGAEATGDDAAARGDHRSRPGSIVARSPTPKPWLNPGPHLG